ncbi:MAG: methyltransferase regulatory domain-containing protein [Bryobacteraceae bacterium]
MTLNEPTNELDYGDLVSRLSHPGYMAAIGTLFGLTPPPVESCRVLELGCGTGFNLIAMSQSTPGGSFTGIDLSDSQIRHGRQVAAELGANNVELHCLSIDDFHPSGEPFDYIIAHGVYAWVPSATRDAILSIVERHLAPSGMAFVSYNTNPGWRLRGLVRDGLRFFVNPADPPNARVPTARQGLDRLTQSLVNPESIYSRTLKAEWDGARDNPDYYLAHEHLLPENNPMYFEEFMRDAAAHNLRFVAESRLVMNSFLQPKSLQAQLVGPDILRREQHLDWLVGRYFRQTLLCHSNVPLSDGPNPNAIAQLRVASMAEILERTQTAMRVRQQDGAEYELADVGFQAALEQLEPAGECPVPAADLQARVLAALEKTGVDAHLRMPGISGIMVASMLWSGCADGLWTLRADAPAMAYKPTPQPVACALARRQAANGTECTNRLHRSVQLSPSERTILKLLDGSRAVPDLARETTTAEVDIERTLARLAALALLSE